jgi:hypothetical protein
MRSLFAKLKQATAFLVAIVILTSSSAVVFDDGADHVVKTVVNNFVKVLNEDDSG